MDFVLGIIGGVCLAQLIVVAWIYREIYSRKVAINAELMAALKVVSDSHNNLTEQVAKMDKDVTAARLRLDMLPGRKG